MWFVGKGPRAEAQLAIAGLCFAGWFDWFSWFVGSLVGRAGGLSVLGGFGRCVGQWLS